MTFTWVVFYNTWICKEASSLFLAHHPYDILKSKQVNILVTYWSWMKRLFQHWICSRTHHHSLQIFQQFLHNNLASTRPSGDKKVLLETQQSFFLKKFSFSLQTSNAKKKTTSTTKTFDFKSANPAIFAVFYWQECTILNGISRKNRFMSALNNTVYRYSG